MTPHAPIVLDGKAYMTGICPECLGMCLVLNHIPTAEYADWAHRVSCQEMIRKLENDGLGHQITNAERAYACGEGA